MIQISNNLNDTKPGNVLSRVLLHRFTVNFLFTLYFQSLKRSIILLYDRQFACIFYVKINLQNKCV